MDNRQSGFQLIGSGPEAYERYIVPAWMGEWAQDLVKTSLLQVGEHVLDIGCGTGVVTRNAALTTGSTGRTVGLDINQAMLSAAQTFLGQHENNNSIEWREANASQMPFEDGEFDVVLSQQALQYFSDQAGALKEITRVLKPAGRVAFSIWRPITYAPYFVSLKNAFESHLGSEVAASIAAWFPDTLREHWRTQMSAAGFLDIHISIKVKMIRYGPLEEFVAGQLSATPLAGDVATMDDEDRKEMFHDIITSLKPYVDDDGLASPIESYVITAHT